MTTIINHYEHERAMQHQGNEAYAIYQNYANQEYNPTHTKVKDIEFFTFPKIFISGDSVSIVTGDQYCYNGTKAARDQNLAYLEHCRSFDTSVDRDKNIVFLIEK